MRKCFVDFPIDIHNVETFAQELRAEGFDACADQYDGQVGLLVGPAGLNTERLPTGELAFFLPLWEVNASMNRPMIADRQFHCVVERRPEGWTYHRQYRDPE